MKHRFLPSCRLAVLPSCLLAVLPSCRLAVLPSCRLAVLPVPVLNTKPTPRVGPLDVAELVADDAAGAALDAAFIREDHPPVVGRHVAVRRAAVDALLTHTVQANVVVDDADVCPRRIDVVGVERQLALDGGRVEDAGTDWRRGLVGRVGSRKSGVGCN